VLNFFAASYFLEYQKIWYRTKLAALVPNFLVQYQIFLVQYQIGWYRTKNLTQYKMSRKNSVFRGLYLDPEPNPPTHSLMDANVCFVVKVKVP
jgi:hypothetical protein